MDTAEGARGSSTFWFFFLSISNIYPAWFWEGHGGESGKRKSKDERNGFPGLVARARDWPSQEMGRAEALQVREFPVPGLSQLSNGDIYHLL